MPAEIIVVSGPLAGTRYALNGQDFHIGRAPSSTLPLPDPGIGTTHCCIRYVQNEWRLFSPSPAHRTYVNGLRVDELNLRDGDQVSVGEHELAFHVSDSSASGTHGEPTLLQACSLLFLFRALAAAGQAPEAAVLETQLLRLIGDFVPIQGGAVMLARNEQALRERAAERGADFLHLVSRVCVEGLVADGSSGMAAVPIYVHDQIGGIIQVSTRAEHVHKAPELLSGIGVLAAAALEGVREAESLRNENACLREQLGEPSAGLIGESAVMQRLRETIARVAPRDSTVLVLGESGTGKELIARALHTQSGRRNAPFIAVNCAALNENLLESELFGHEKGAFTGAMALRKGRLEMAEGGTVFLDELGELAPGLQAKLLRVLQEREFERLGGSRTIRLDVRLIAATNRDLATEVRAGRFRDDLYHRLNVIALRTFPLRAHPEDILPLARHFLKRAAAKCGRRVDGFTPAAERSLEAYSWPGNVRELQNAVEHAVVLGISGSVYPEDLPETVLDSAPLVTMASPQNFQNAVGSARRQSIVRAWEQANGDYKAAAAILEIHPNSLLRLIRNLGLRETLQQR